FIKSMRGSDPDAAIYWLARMIDGGEAPLYILRRLIRFASEDIGLADPNALLLALAARDSYHMLGTPEGELAIAQLVIYLACAPKSNSAYLAWQKAQKMAADSGSLPTPLDIRNAPTKLMKNLGYGREYQYAHDHPDALTDQEYFPKELAGTELYFPSEVGREKKLADYLKWYRDAREKLRAETGK
ncbi:MAG: recombination factor protein RarA, partial [candidate division Zixibacteria bacterium]|nr:recombination factor protein RarA [candidate division Zixibacteria bacterium]